MLATRTIWITISAVVWAALVATDVSVADEVEPLRTIRTMGEGKATASPDMATIRTGVVTQAESAKQALADNNVAMQKVLAAVKQSGVADKDVQTVNFSVSPVYDRYDRDERLEEAEPQEPRITGYRVHNEVSVQVRDLESLGDVLESLVAAGSNQLSGVNFDVADPTDLLNEARGRAIHNARASAEVYAEAAGVELGQVRSIAEEWDSPPRPMYAAMEMRAASTVPVATGEQEYRVRAEVAYEIKN